jgi:nitrogen fixation protein
LHRLQRHDSLVAMVSERSTARANPARGLALIATAVIIGFFLLRNGWDQNVPDVPPADAAEASPGAGGAAPEGDSSSTTAPAAEARPAAEVIVQVANTTSVGGAGGCVTTQLAERQYQTRDATDAQPALDTTVIHYQAGFEAEAAALADLFQLAEAPSAMPNPPPVQTDANLLVLLGADLAQPC